jgi:hypothetical protein
MGMLAFATVLVRGMLHGNEFPSTATTACGMLLVFAVVGALVAAVARWIVEDSVRSQMQAELKEHGNQ